MAKMKYSDNKLGRPRKGVGYKKTPLVIVSKYKGYCLSCLKDIPVGEWVVYLPKRGIEHQRCHKG